MKVILSCSVMVSMAFCLRGLGAGDKGDDPKEALQALQDYIGGWKGNGTSEKNKTEIWKETANWSWRFKSKDVFLSVEMPESKTFKKGEMRFLPKKGAYELTLTDRNDKKQIFEGELKKGSLILERLDPDSKDTQQIKINTAGGGLRLVVTYSTKLDGRTLFNKQFQVAYTKEGENFGAAAKKNECVVTGGLGTMTVTYMGQTYYVCCSGCRDLFNENPAKIIKEYLARKKASQ
jgi:hypothetical protein